MTSCDSQLQLYDCSVRFVEPVAEPVSSGPHFFPIVSSSPLSPFFVAFPLYFFCGLSASKSSFRLSWDQVLIKQNRTARENRDEAPRHWYHNPSVSSFRPSLRTPCPLGHLAISPPILGFSSTPITYDWRNRSGFAKIIPIPFPNL